MDFFKEEEVGCETTVKDSELIDLGDYCSTTGEIEALKKIINYEKVSGKRIIELRLDDEYHPIITLLDMINESNGGKKLRYLYRGDDK